MRSFDELIAKLTPNEWKIYKYLKEFGKSDTTPVANGTGINRKSIGRYAQSLSMKGLITRQYRMEKSVRYWELEIAESKPEPKAEILEIPKIEWTESDEQNVMEQNKMYDLSVERLEFDITSDRIRTAYFLLFDKSTRGTIKQIKRQIKNNL